MTNENLKSKITRIPISLREANDFVEQFHRHNGRTTKDGGKFAIAAEHSDSIVGVAIVGRPLCRHLDDSMTAEVLRLCTHPNAPANVCSMLYRACWQAWSAMGGTKLITYTLTSESGSSLKGAGFKIVYQSKPSSKGWSSTGRIRQWQPIYGQMKFRWELSK